MRRLATVVALLLAVGTGRAGPDESSRALPPELRDVKFEPVLKEQIPPGLRFRDERGYSVRLGDYFGGSRPVILVLVQYRCPMLCNLVLNGLTESLRCLAGKKGFRGGEQFRVVTVSFDERETPDLAAAKKAAHVEAYGFPGAAEGWHFLTGEKEEIAKLADKCGFAFRYDAKKDQFAHPSGILIL
ncbi:MAG: SCO family protein, partial [Planctomycetes bacterium]|nr:SCO family protein [Planctomycetota bacterium]